MKDADAAMEAKWSGMKREEDGSNFRLGVYSTEGRNFDVSTLDIT
jgi:hypothetical protein